MRMTVDGEALRIRSTMSATVFAPWTVAVGLFGLLKKTRPASPFDAAAIIPSTSRRIAESTFTSVSGSLYFFAKPVQFSNVGSAVTSAFCGVTHARIAFFRISCEPAPSTMFSDLTRNRSASAPTSAPSVGLLLKG